MTWQTQFYPSDGDWLVSNAPLEVFGTRTIASFDTEEDAERFADAYNRWETTAPEPHEYGGEESYGNRCRVPGCPVHIAKGETKCPAHGGGA